MERAGHLELPQLEQCLGEVADLDGVADLVRVEGESGVVGRDLVLGRLGAAVKRR